MKAGALFLTGLVLVRNASFAAAVIRAAADRGAWEQAVVNALLRRRDGSGWRRRVHPRSRFA